MSEASEKFNALPDDQRWMLWSMLVEGEIRLINQAMKQLTSDYRKAMKAHRERAKAMQRSLDARKMP